MKICEIYTKEQMILFKFLCIFFFLIILRRIFNVYLLIIVSSSLSIYHLSDIKLLCYILIGFALLTVSVKECLNKNYGIVWIGLKYTAYI